MEVFEGVRLHRFIRPSSMVRCLHRVLAHPGFRGSKLEREIITSCAGTKSHTYDE
jgi:hypothetical protein